MRIDRVRHLAAMLVLAAMLASLAGGCAGPGPYQTSAPGACVRFVEFDDFGNLFNRAQIGETLDAARTVAAQGGVVVVYVHGWDHNAASADPDVLKFYEAMHDARTIDGQYGGKRDVLGIHVGWRAQSLAVPLLSKLTFWERKTTAQAAGDGAVFELLRQRANYREQNVKSRLVVIGHSFGAAIVYSALSHSLTAQIIQDPLVQVAGSTRNLRHVMKAPPGMPIVNIRTTGEVMRGHNDIWNPTMRAFLVQLMIKIVERGEQPAHTR